MLSSQQECFFYGLNAHCDFPIKERKIELPVDLKPQQISFNHNKLMLLDANNVAWHFNKSDEQSLFSIIYLPNRELVESVMAGKDAILVLTKKGYCYVQGDNRVSKLGTTEDEFISKLKFLNLPYLTFSIFQQYYEEQKQSSKQNEPEHLFLESLKSNTFQDNTDIIQALAEDPRQYIEINKPNGFGKSLTLSMLYTFYSNKLTANCFGDKKIGLDAELIKQEQGQYPIIFLDFNELDMSSHSAFIDSYEKLMAKLYLEYREILFKRVLKNKEYEKDKYQSIAVQDSEFFTSREEQLPQLLKYIYQQYGVGAKLLIDNADLYLHQNDRLEIEASLEEFLCPIIDSHLMSENNQFVSQVIVMSTHPTCFKSIRSEEITAESCSYDQFFQFQQESMLEANKTILEPAHFIHQLKISPDHCNLLEKLIKGEIVHTPVHPDTIYKLDGEYIFQYLIETGLLSTSKTTENELFTALSVPNQLAKNELQALQKKWHLQNLNRITVVSDIDNFLATHDECSSEVASFFFKKGAIITVCALTHYIPPGILELMQFLFSTPLPFFKGAFYSTGADIRNQPLVKEILTIALGEERYNEIKSEITILSRNNCSKVHKQNSEKQYEYFGISSKWHTYKKDIRRAIAKEDSIERAILIDNDPGNIFYGQEKNYLYTDTVESKHFESLSQENCACSNAQDELFRILNAPFRLAGILKRLLDTREDRSITEDLFNSQFIAKTVTEENNTLRFEPHWHKLTHCQDYYDEGLKLLQQFNPELEFVTPTSYKMCMDGSFSQNERKEIEEAMSQVSEDQCCMTM